MKYILIILAVLITLGCEEDEEFIPQAEKICAGVEIEEPNWGRWKNDTCIRFAKGLLVNGQGDLLPCELGTTAHFCRRLENGDTQLFTQRGVEVYPDRYDPHEVTKYVTYPGQERVYQEHEHWTLVADKGVDFWYDYEKDELVRTEYAVDNPSFVGFAGFRSGVTPTTYQVHGGEHSMFVTLTWPAREVVIKVKTLPDQTWCPGFTRVRDDGFILLVHDGACGTASWRNTIGLVDDYKGF